MRLRKERRAKLEVIGIDVKNFPAISQLPHAPRISKDTLDLITGRLQRHRDEFRRIYNENHRHESIPLSLRTDEEVDAAAAALSGVIPITNEYMRLKETFTNLVHISQNVQGDQAVCWMGVTATFDGSESSRVLVSSVKEGTKRFSWVSSDLRSNVSLPVKTCFPRFHPKHISVEENRPLRLFLSHHWKPKDERTISSEDIATTLVYAELPLVNMRFCERPCTIYKDLPLVLDGRTLHGVNGGDSPCMTVTISIGLEE